MPGTARPPRFAEAIYLLAIVKGLAVTARHFFRNLFHWRQIPTLQWPDAARPLPPGYRGEHRLMTRPDGRVRCTSCMLCATACPAHCIHIEAAETADPAVEKYPVRYEIDVFRCIFCGLCVEACPCDAIRMDTGKLNPAGSRRIYDLDYLIHNHPPGLSPVSSALY